jgi:hypothetical protein
VKTSRRYSTAQLSATCVTPATAGARGTCWSKNSCRALMEESLGCTGMPTRVEQDLGECVTEVKQQRTGGRAMNRSIMRSYMLRGTVHSEGARDRGARWSRHGYLVAAFLPRGSKPDGASRMWRLALGIALILCVALAAVPQAHAAGFDRRPFKKCFENGDYRFWYKDHVGAAVADKLAASEDYGRLPFQAAVEVLGLQESELPRQKINVYVDPLSRDLSMSGFCSYNKRELYIVLLNRFPKRVGHIRIEEPAADVSDRTLFAYAQTLSHETSHFLYHFYTKDHCAAWNKGPRTQNTNVLRTSTLTEAIAFYTGNAHYYRLKTNRQSPLFRTLVQRWGGVQALPEDAGLLYSSNKPFGKHVFAILAAWGNYLNDRGKIPAVVRMVRQGVLRRSPNPFKDAYEHALGMKWSDTVPAANQMLASSNGMANYVFADFYRFWHPDTATSVRRFVRSDTSSAVRSFARSDTSPPAPNKRLPYGFSVAQGAARLPDTSPPSPNHGQPPRFASAPAAAPQPYTGPSQPRRTLPYGFSYKGRAEASQ